MKKIFISLVVTLILLTNISMAGIDAPDMLSNSKLQSEASEAFNIAHKIFGDAWDIATNDNYDSSQSSSGILSSISEILTLVALLLVSVLVTWTITTSAVDVASTGNSTSNQYSGVWLPVRTALSVLFLAPMAGGYAMIQIIVLAVASWGMQAGDAVWQASLDHLLKTPQEQVVQSKSTFENDKKYVNPYSSNILGGSFLRVKPTLPLADLFDTLVCYEFVKTLDKKGLLQEETYSWRGVKVEKHQPYRRTTVASQFDEDGVSVIKHEWGTSKYKTLCGKLEQVIVLPDDEGINYTKADYLAWQNVINKAFYQFYNESSLVAAAQSAQLFFSDEGITKKQFLENFSVKELALAYKKYQETIVKASVKLLNKNQNNKKFIEVAKKSGWLYAGGFYWGMKSINEETQNLLVQSQPKSVEKVEDLNNEVGKCALIEISSWGMNCMSPWQEYLHLANGYPADSLKKLYLSIEFFNKHILRVIEKERFDKQDWLESVLKLDQGVGTTERDSSLANKIMDAIIGWFNVASTKGGNIITRAMISSQNPLADIQSKGHWILETGYTAYFGTWILANIAEKLSAHTDMVTTFFQVILAFLIATGVFLAYYMPMIPLITWVAAVVGYIFFLFEAFIGSIFWAGAHAMPEGNGISGQHAEQGYMLMLSLVVRPSLMVVGFIAGMFLSTVLLNFVGELATPYFEQVHGNNMVGLIGWTSGVFIMGSLALSIVRSFIKNLCSRERRFLI
jgi:conjugal transfer/type IV secretion protein DotA/TraY